MLVSGPTADPALFLCRRCCCCCQVINVTPRYAKLKSADGKEVLGWENIELISDRPLEVMLKELKQLKQEFPDRWGAVFGGEGMHAGVGCTLGAGVAAVPVQG